MVGFSACLCYFAVNVVEHQAQSFGYRLMSCHSPLFNRGRLYMALHQESLPSPRLNFMRCTDRDSTAYVLPARETLLSTIE